MTLTRSGSGGGRGGKKSKPALNDGNEDNDTLLPSHDDNDEDDNSALHTSASSSSLLPRKRHASKSPAPPEMMEAAFLAHNVAGIGTNEEGTRMCSSPVNDMNVSDINNILHNSMDDNEGEDSTTGRRGSRASVSLNASFEAAAAASTSRSPKKKNKSLDFDANINDDANDSSVSNTRKSFTSQHPVPDTPLRPPNNSKVSKRQKGGGILFSPKPVYGKGGSGDRMKKSAVLPTLKNGGGGLKMLKRPPPRTDTNYTGRVAAGDAGGGGEGSSSDLQSVNPSNTFAHPHENGLPSSPPKTSTGGKKTSARSPATPFRFHAFPDSLPRVHPRGLTSAKEGGLIFDNVGGTNNSNPTPFRLDESFGTNSSNSSIDGKHKQQVRGGISSRLKDDVSMRNPHSPATRRLFRPNPTTLAAATTTATGGSTIQSAPTKSFDAAESSAAISDALLVARNDSTDQNDISGEWSEPTEMSMTNKLIRMSNVPTSINTLQNHQEGDEDDEIDTVMEEDIMADDDGETSDQAGLPGTKLDFNSPRETGLLLEKSKTPDHQRIQFNLDMSPIYGDDVGMADKGNDSSPTKGVKNHEGKVEELQNSSHLPSNATPVANNPDVSALSAGDMSDATASTVNANNTTRYSYASGFTRLNPRRTSRPMPDTSAFDVCTPSQSSFRSKDSGTQSKASELLCPPTPIRTPAWAHNAESVFEKGGQGQHLQRANSLIATKVLAECPLRVFDNLSSLEDSMLEHDVSGTTESAPHTTFFLPVEEKDENDSIEGDGGMSKTVGMSDNCVVDEMTPLKSDILPAGKQQSRLSLEATTDVGPVTFSDFENVGILGSGAFADVFKVRSKKDQAFYAIKRTRRQFRGVKDRERAMSEVNTMKRLQSAVLSEASSSLAASSSNQKSHNESAGKANYGLYLLFFIRAWQQDGFFYCQTELCSRATCRQLRQSLTADWEKDVVKYPSLVSCLNNDSEIKKGMAKDRLVPERDTWQICHDISRGLFHIHSHGMVHYDIKPSNIFFVVTKWGTICKIGDFGLAGDIGSSDDGQEGDTSYMANELLSSSLKHPGADIFSLGLTLHELAASASWTVPREGDRWHDLRSGPDTLELPTTRTESLVALIQRMIHPDPKQRPTSEEITERADVKRASATIDSFLSQYVGDVARHDSRREKEMESAEEEARRRSTTPVSSLLSPTATRLLRTKTPTFERG